MFWTHRFQSSTFNLVNVAISGLIAEEGSEIRDHDVIEHLQPMICFNQSIFSKGFPRCQPQVQRELCESLLHLATLPPDVQVKVEFNFGHDGRF